jgi:competence protein ComGC
VKYFYLIAGTLIILVIISLSIFLPPYLEKKQKQRDRGLGCFQYRQMLKESEKSYALNPNGKKWVRESMAAEGLRKDFGCSDKNKRSN